MNLLQQQDPKVWAAIQAEAERQRDGLEMIASENYTSPAVMQAAGSVLTNKYAEGYPGRRYYGGCEYVDVVEELAIDQRQGAVWGRVMPMSSRIPDRRPTRRSIWRPCSRAIRCWDSTWPTAGT